MGEAMFRQGLYFNLHSARQPENDPVHAVHRQAVHQPGPQALVKLGDELRKVLHALDEPLDLPVADHDLIDLPDDSIALMLGLFIAAHQRVVALVVFVICSKPSARKSPEDYFPQGEDGKANRKLTV